MRIGLVTGEYPPDRGGVGDFTSRLSTALAARGHEVHVITAQSHCTASGSVECERLDPGTRPVTVNRVVNSWNWRCWGQIAGLARDLALDVLDLQYQAAAYGMHPAINLVPAPRSRPPVAVTFHDLKVPYLFPKVGPLRWWTVRTLARRADVVIVTNREDHLRLQDEIGPHELRLIPIGSNIPVSPPVGYDRHIERARWDIEPDDILLGYFGFLNQSKGGEELIRALHVLAEKGLPVHLLKVGGRVGSSDPTDLLYADRVEELIADLGLTERVHWTGYASPQEISAALLSTDICVLPYRDGVSFRRGSLLACMAHGRAVVTTRPAVSLPEARNGETMMLVAPGDPLALAQAVSQVASSSELRSRLECQARILAEEFSWERIARETLDVFGGLIGDIQ